MAEISERHEVRVRGRDGTIVFVADSHDGRLIIRQETEGQKGSEVCAITLSDPDELRGFFDGLRRVLSSLEEQPGPAATPEAAGGRPPGAPRGGPVPARSPDEREAVIAQARQRNPQAFAPWTKDEEQQVRQRYEGGETVSAIARAHRRSPRAIELRLQKLGVLPPDQVS
jgi:hypothetical protein